MYLTAKNLFNALSGTLRANRGCGLDDPTQHATVTLSRFGNAEAGVKVVSDQPNFLERLAAHLIVAREVEVAVKDGYATYFRRFVRTRKGWREMAQN